MGIYVPHNILFGMKTGKATQRTPENTKNCLHRGCEKNCFRKSEAYIFLAVIDVCNDGHTVDVRFVCRLLAMLQFNVCTL